MGLDSLHRCLLSGPPPSPPPLAVADLCPQWRALETLLWTSCGGRFIVGEEAENQALMEMRAHGVRKNHIPKISRTESRLVIVDPDGAVLSEDPLLTLPILPRPTPLPPSSTSPSPAATPSSPRAATTAPPPSPSSSPPPPPSHDGTMPEAQRSS